MRPFAFLILLAGCAGGTGDPVVVPDQSFDAVSARIMAQDVTAFAALPTLGLVRYQGMARLNLPLQHSAMQPYTGAFAVDVPFGPVSGPIGGTITALQGPGGAVTGALQIGNLQIDPTAQPRKDYQFSADLAGALVQGGQSHSLSAALSGDFYGPGGADMAGVIYRGLIRQGDEIDVFDGAFVAQRGGSGG